MKGGRRKNKKGEFITPSVSEMLSDRNHYIESKTVEVIQFCDKIARVLRNLTYLKQVILLRQNQIDNYHDLSDEYIETFNGLRKPKPMLESEHNLDVYNHNSLVREYSLMLKRLEDGFEFGSDFIKFSQDEITLMLKGDFDYIKWQEEFSNKHKLNTNSLNSDSVTDEVIEQVIDEVIVESTKESIEQEKEVTYADKA